ncbi:hypothetical protein [Roseococcus sp. YIM B11640]|uniref:hypothetical protein n=1 Tax=Roseococcus sp. YIM B11640 TaxID=3133973 RepID=UPI003C7BC74D
MVISPKKECQGLVEIPRGDRFPMSASNTIIDGGMEFASCSVNGEIFAAARGFTHCESALNATLTQSFLFHDARGLISCPP